MFAGKTLWGHRLQMLPCPGRESGEPADGLGVVRRGIMLNSFFFFKEILLRRNKKTSNLEK